MLCVNLFDVIGQKLRKLCYSFLLILNLYIWSSLPTFHGILSEYTLTKQISQLIFSDTQSLFEIQISSIESGLL
jgi:hypothetical protein